MAMGRRQQRQRQKDLWVAAGELARSTAHPFYRKLNKLLDEHGFDPWVEGLCEKFYAPTMGRPSLPPGMYFRTLLIGYFEGIDSESGIGWRIGDSLSLRRFLLIELDEATPDHSTISRTRRLIDQETHRAVLSWVLQLVAKAGLLQGSTIGVDATTLEANAALRSIVRRASGESYEEFLTRLAAGITEVVADMGYHSNDVLTDLTALELRSYISEPDRGRRRWQGKRPAPDAVYANRRRIRGARGRRLLRWRAERVERSFAHLYDRGGMRRTLLRGRRNILKRLLIQVGGFNLSLVLRQKLGASTPRGYEWQRRPSNGSNNSYRGDGRLRGRLGAAAAMRWVGRFPKRNRNPAVQESAPLTENDHFRHGLLCQRESVEGARYVGRGH